MRPEWYTGAVFNLYRSNRVEKLLDTLVEVLGEPLADPFQAEWVCVQSLGMRTWLNQELARRLGVWANAWFPFPRDLVRSLERRLLDRQPTEPDPHSKQGLTWAILARLPACMAAHPREFAALKQYMEGPAGGLKAYQLATRIAGLYDQYFLYRPDMLTAWERGERKDWQAILFREVMGSIEAEHPGRVARRLLQALGQPLPAEADLPLRLSVFGLSSLPPFYLQVLNGLSQHLDLNLFLLDPSQEFWTHIRSQRDIFREAERAGCSPDEAAELLHLEQGPALLASLGRQGQHFQIVLERSIDYVEPAGDLFEDPMLEQAPSLLAALQSDILNMRNPVEVQSGPPDGPGLDGSIQVHACHSPMREVEVLHDRLLHLFEGDRSLEPHDVLVMCSDIETYAPLVESVFGAGAGLRIPFSISDRRQRSQAQVIGALFALLDMARSRVSLGAVFDLLSMEPVRTRFGLSEQEVAQALGWARQAGIRWGLDAAHRRAFGQPPVEENTWRFGLERLFLGYAMPAGDDSLFAGRLACEAVEGLEADVLGRFASFHLALTTGLESLAEARGIGAWRESILELMEALVAEDRTSHHQIQMIREVLGEMSDLTELAECGQAFDLSLLRQALVDRLDDRVSLLGFLSGGVTFCNLQPMRSLPFPVVCLLGMSESAFPRTERPLAFDLMSQQPQIGDRCRRDDDRYLFLEAVLAARRCLLVSYVGRSIRDNSELPPSVVVSELLDVIAQRAQVDSGEILTIHPLQAFSPSYFSESGHERGLFSYAEHWCHGAGLVSREPEPDPGFVSDPLPAPAEDGPVRLDDLIRFFQNPAGYLLSRRLGLKLVVAEESLDEREPLNPNKLDEYLLGEWLLTRGLQEPHVDGSSLLPLARARGVLPSGTAGEVAFARVAAETAPILHAARQHSSGTALAPLSVDLKLSNGRLVGELSGIWPQQQLIASYGRFDAKRRINLWLRHLALRCVAPAGYPSTSLLIGRGKEGLESLSVGDPGQAPARLLEGLVDLYRTGQRQPLPFFPRSSLAFAEKVFGLDPQDPHVVAAGLAAARKVWEPTPRTGAAPIPGERDDPALRKVLGDLDPFEGTGAVGFARASLDVFESMLSCLAGRGDP